MKTFIYNFNISNWKDNDEIITVDQVRKLLKIRKMARGQKDFKLSDEIRTYLRSKGWEIRDLKNNRLIIYEENYWKRKLD